MPVPLGPPNIPFLRRREAAQLSSKQLSSAARAVEQRTPETLSVVRHRAQPAAVTIARSWRRPL